MDSKHMALKVYPPGDDRIGPFNFVMITERIHNLQRRYLAAGIMSGLACGGPEEEENCIQAGLACLHDKPHGNDVSVIVPSLIVGQCR